MDQLISWLQPAVVVGVVLFTSNLTNKRISNLQVSLNKRIDDLRAQMVSDHTNLSNHLARVEKKLDDHIGNYDIHISPEQDNRS